jgi:hypothetical protein
MRGFHDFLRQKPTSLFILLAPNKPLCWFCYVDNTFVIWTHGPDKLKDFLNLLNSIHQCIQFIMETKTKVHPPFLDIDIYWRPNGSLQHRVYRKPTHSSLYITAGYHHHPSNERPVPSTPVHKARVLCD